MEVKKIIGVGLIIAGAALFYAGFTATATEALTEWMTQHSPNLKGHYTAKELLLAWGGMLAGFGGLIGFGKK